MSHNSADLPRPNGEHTTGERTPLLHEGCGNGNHQTNKAVTSEVEPSTAKLLSIMCFVWLGSFLAALDTTVTSTLSAPISSSFHSLSLISWLGSSYLIANAALQPLSGKLTDIYSRRSGLLVCSIVFAVGNLVCGIARSQSAIILGRVVTGLGGGGLTAISTFVANDLVPLRSRGLWQGFGNIMFGMGHGLGGVFGGFINDGWGWRWAFIIQTPLALLSGFGVWCTLPVPRAAKSGREKSRLYRVDFTGSALLVVALTLLLLALNSGGSVVPWAHPLVTVTLPAAAVLLGTFIYVEAFVAPEPVIPVRILLDRSVAAACLTNWFNSMALFSLVYYVPILFQLQGRSTTTVGAQLIPLSIGTAFGSLNAGIIIRATGRFQRLGIAILLVFLAGALGFAANTHLDTPAWSSMLNLLLVGSGYGGTLTVMLLALLASVPRDMQAVATATSYAFRSTGSTIGVTLASLLFRSVLLRRLRDLFSDFPNATTEIARIADDFGAMWRLPIGLRAGVLSCYIEALKAVFIVVVGFAALAVGCGMFVAERELGLTLQGPGKNSGDDIHDGGGNGGVGGEEVENRS